MDSDSTTADPLVTVLDELVDELAETARLARTRIEQMTASRLYHRAVSARDLARERLPMAS